MFGILIEGEFLRDEVYDTIEEAEARIRVLQELDREEWPDEEDADYSAVKIDPDTMDRLGGDEGNGTYIIEDWRIVDRRYFDGEEDAV